MVGVSHVKTLTMADAADTSIVRPSDWNSGHIVSLASNDILALSAGVASLSTGPVVFSNSNGVSFGLSTGAGGGTMTASVGVAGTNSVTVLGNTAGVSSGTLGAGQMVLAGGNNITLSQSNGTVTISGPNTVAQTSLSFSNANGVSFGTAGSTLTASVAAQSAQPVGSFGVSTGGNTLGNTGTVTNELILAGGNNVTLSQATGAGGATVTISAAAQTVQPLSISLGGNTSGTTTITGNALTLAGGNNITVSGAGSAITISGPNTVAQTNQSLGAYGVGNTAGQSSSSTLDARSVSFDGAGAVSVGLSGGSVVISAPTQTVQPVGSFGVSTGGNTAGDTGTVTNRLVLAGGNNITLSQGTAAGGVTVTISAPNQTNQQVGLYAVSNTTQSTSVTADARSLSFAGAGAASVGATNGSIVISVAAGAQSVQTVGLYGVGNTTQNSSTTLDARTLSFDGLGAVTVGFSNGSIQLSAPVQTNQTEGVYAVGNTTGAATSTTVDARSLSFQGTGGVSVGMSNGSIVISGGAGGVQSNQTIGLYGVGNTTQNSSTTLDARTLSFDGLGGISVGFSNGSVQISGPQTVAQSNERLTIALAGNTAGTSTATGSTILLAGGNNITLSGDGTQVTVVGPNTAAQTNQSVGFYAVGNTASTSTSTTLDARTVSFNGGGIVSVGFSNGSINISATTPSQTNQTVGFYAVGNTASTSTSTTLDARTISFNGAGIVSVGMSAGSVIVSATQSVQTEGYYAVGNTMNTTSLTLDARSLSIQGGGDVSIGFSNGSLQVSGPQTVMMSLIEPVPLGANSSAMSFANFFWVANPFSAPVNMSFCALAQFETLNLVTATTVRTNTTGTRSNTWAQTDYFGIYSQQTGASSTQIGLVFSTSSSFAVMDTLAVTLNVSTLSVAQSISISFVKNIDASGGMTYGTTSQALGSSTNTTQATSLTISYSTLNAMTGTVLARIGWGSSLSPGNYWLVKMRATSSTIATAGASISAQAFGSIADVYMSQNSFAGNALKSLGGSATDTAQYMMPFFGGAVAAATAGLPNVIGTTDINHYTSDRRLYFNFQNTVI